MYERPFLSERVFDIGSCLGVWKDVLADGKRADVSQAQPQPSRSNIISFRLTRLYQQFSRVLSCSVHKADVPARYVRLPLPFPKSKKKKTERGEKEIINKSTQVWWIDKPPVGKRIHLISNSIGGGAGFFFRPTRNCRMTTRSMDEIAHVDHHELLSSTTPLRMLGLYFVSVQDLNGLAQQDNLAAIRSSNFQANKLTEANSRSTLITTAHCRGTSSSLNSLAVL